MDNRKPPVGGIVSFECPADFSASPFAPGPPFSQETLKGPSKQLWLIRAPANFSPESLDGHVMPLLGSQTVKVPQPDGTHTVYSLQTTAGDQGSPHLLVPSAHRDHLTCAPSFSGSLSICKRYGNPDANQPLFPLVARLAPQIPEGLKQRFLPFGAQPKNVPPQKVAEEPPRKKKKKQRQLQTVGYMRYPEELLPLKQEPHVGAGSEMPAEGFMVSGGTEGFEEGKTSRKHKKQQKKGAAEEEGSTVLSVISAIEQPLEHDSQPSSSLEAPSQNSPLFGEADLSHRSKKKKKKKKKKFEEEVVEKGEFLLDPSSFNQQCEPEPQLQEDPETHAGENDISKVEGLVQRKHKKKRKRGEEARALMDLTSVKEEAVREMWDFSSVGTVFEGSLVLPKEEPGMGLSSGPRKKKKKKKEEVMEDQPQEQEVGIMLLEPNSVSQEPEGWDELGILPGQGVEQRESLEPSVEVSSQKHKKKKKKRKREDAEEGLEGLKLELKSSQE